MAKAKPTKLQNFFEGRRRKAFLVDYTHLKTKAGESRMKLSLRMPLLNESLVGMNEAIGEAFTIMAKDTSKVTRTSLNVQLEGMTLECFTTSDTESSKKPNVSSTGVKMIRLALDSGGESEKRQINLLVVGYVPASIQLRDWAWEHLHQEFGLEAVYSQSEMDFSDIEAASDDDTSEDEEEEEGDEDEEEEEEEEPVMVASDGGGADDPTSDKPGKNWRAPLPASSVGRIRRSTVN